MKKGEDGVINKWWVKSKSITYRNKDMVERINKGVSLCASKYWLLSVLNISLPLT